MEEILTEPGTDAEAVERALEALEGVGGIGHFARPAVPPLIGRLRAMNDQDCLTVALLLIDLAPLRAAHIGQLLVTYSEPRGTGARRG